MALATDSENQSPDYLLKQALNARSQKSLYDFEPVQRSFKVKLLRTSQKGNIPEQTNIMDNKLMKSKGESESQHKFNKHIASPIIEVILPSRVKNKPPVKGKLQDIPKSGQKLSSLGILELFKYSRFKHSLNNFSTPTKPNKTTFIHSTIRKTRQRITFPEKSIPPTPIKDAYKSNSNMRVDDSKSGYCCIHDQTRPFSNHNTITKSKNMSLASVMSRRQSNFSRRNKTFGGTMAMSYSSSSSDSSEEIPNINDKTALELSNMSLDLNKSSTIHRFTGRASSTENILYRQTITVQNDYNEHHNITGDFDPNSNQSGQLDRERYNPNRLDINKLNNSVEENHANEDGNISQPQHVEDYSSSEEIDRCSQNSFYVSEQIPATEENISQYILTGNKECNLAEERDYTRQNSIGRDSEDQEHFQNDIIMDERNEDTAAYISTQENRTLHHNIENVEPSSDHKKRTSSESKSISSTVNTHKDQILNTNCTIQTDELTNTTPPIVHGESGINKIQRQRPETEIHDITDLCISSLISTSKPVSSKERKKPKNKLKNVDQVLEDKTHRNKSGGDTKIPKPQIEATSESNLNALYSKIMTRSSYKKQASNKQNSIVPLNRVNETPVSCGSNIDRKLHRRSKNGPSDLKHNKPRIRNKTLRKLELRNMSLDLNKSSTIHRFTGRAPSTENILYRQTITVQNDYNEHHNITGDSDSNSNKSGQLDRESYDPNRLDINKLNNSVEENCANKDGNISQLQHVEDYSASGEIDRCSQNSFGINKNQRQRPETEIHDITDPCISSLISTSKPVSSKERKKPKNKLKNVDQVLEDKTHRNKSGGDTKIPKPQIEATSESNLNALYSKIMTRSSYIKQASNKQNSIVPLNRVNEIQVSRGSNINRKLHRRSKNAPSDLKHNKPRIRNKTLRKATKMKNENCSCSNQQQITNNSVGPRRSSRPPKPMFAYWRSGPRQIIPVIRDINDLADSYDPRIPIIFIPSTPLGINKYKKILSNISDRAQFR